MDPEEKEIQQRVLQAIASGKVKMRSRWYFGLQTTLAIIGGVILGLFLIYIVGFIIFLLRQSGALFAPEIGFLGWYIFLRSLPWFLIVLSLIFLLVLVVLVNHFSFAYQRPLLYSLLGILIVVAAASIFIAFTPLDNAGLYADTPILGPYYSNYGTGDLADIHRGEIMALSINGFILENLSGQTSTVILGTGLPTTTLASFRPGDLVVVFGDRDVRGLIEASAIEKITP